MKLRKTDFGEIVYLIYFLIIIINQMLSNIAIGSNNINTFLNYGSYFFAGLVVIKILVDWTKNWSSMDVFVAILTVGTFCLSNMYLHHSNLWQLVILVVGARGIDFSRIAKSYLVATLVLLLVVVGATIIGYLPNYIYYRVNSHPRYSMGFYYPTDFCAYLFFICILWGYIRNTKIRYVEILAISIVAIISLAVSEGFNTTICLVVTVCILILSKIFKEKIKFNKIFEYLIIALPLIISFVSIVLGTLYNSSNSVWRAINKLSGNRIANISDVFARYNITLFGEPMYSLSPEELVRYNFPKNALTLDNLYVSILIKFGILALLGLILGACLIMHYHCSKKLYIQALLLSVILIHSFIEQRAFNPFVLLLFAGNDSILSFSTLKTKLNSWKEKNGLSNTFTKNILSLMLFALIVEILSFNMTSLVTSFNKGIFASECNAVLHGVENTEDGTFLATDNFSVSLETNDKNISNLDISLNFYDAFNHKFQKDFKYSVEIYKYNDKANAIEYVDNVKINLSKPYSEFIEFDEPLDTNYLVLNFNINGTYQFDVNGIVINSPKPFNISYIRVLIIFVVLVCIYYFGIEKKESEPSETTVEVQKATADFTSTGELRTEAHKDMKSVYANKSKFYIGLKRLMDIILSSIGIIILSPIFLITIIAIKIEDRGPAFFVQYRAGKDLKPFKMWKFRSMYVNADEKLKELMADNEQTGHAFKMKNDPRITKVGKIIRKFSIDELPQLFNVFLGDMSIVGPRPILVFQMEECDDYDKQRLIVQPGLTCIWQVSGRANIKWDKWVELDLDYIDKMSLWTDIKLILLTIPVVITGDGAF